MQQNDRTENNKRFHVIIAAAGTGQRLGSDIPKQYIKLFGKTVLRHTLDNILNWPGLASLQVIIDPKHAKWYQEAVLGLDLPEPIAGGKTRKESISNALDGISNVGNKGIILVHDAARPFIKWRDVQKLLQNIRPDCAASLAVPISDTLRNNESVIDREGLWALQTPQAFTLEDLKKAHENASPDMDYTDDTSLVSAIGVHVELVEGSRDNIKITTPGDLKMAEALLSQQTETRTGFGFDVHAFDTDSPNTPLILCGVEIEHDYPLKGHSDADVGLHALTDAILGAIGKGDIGTHFPPSDDAYKDMDSAVFLKKAVEILNEKGGTIQNLDLTLICETPKIGPHQDTMKSKVSQIVDLEPSRINIKATTTEKLGFTGRGEGIAAQAIATIKVPYAV